MSSSRPTRRRSEIPLPKNLPAWPYQCEHHSAGRQQCKRTAMRGAMRCKTHARVWEFKGAGLRYLVWCLAPTLAVMDESSLKYISRELIWAHWKTYMEQISDLTPDQRFEITSWMVEHFDDVTERGWLKANGTYVKGVPSAKPWPEAVSLEEARLKSGLTRSEIAALLGCSVQGADIRKLSQGFAWPDSQLLIHRVPLLSAWLHEHCSGEPEYMRVRLFTPDIDTHEALYDELLTLCHSWNPIERKPMSDFIT